MPRTAVVERFSTEEAFWSLRVEDLKPLARLLTETAPTRKGELADLVTRTMRDPAKVRDLYAGLSEQNQATVQEAAHDAAGTLDRARFQAKYGQPPEFGAGATTTALRLFFPVGWSLPRDLQSRLLTFVPEPRSARIATCAEVPESIERQEFVYDWETRKRDAVTWQEPVRVRETEREALHGLPAVLRLIDAGKVGISATTRRPVRAALKLAAHRAGRRLRQPPRKQAAAHGRGSQGHVASASRGPPHRLEQVAAHKPAGRVQPGECHQGPGRQGESWPHRRLPAARGGRRRSVRLSARGMDRRR